MWNATRIEVDDQDIFKEHVRILAQAVDDVAEMDVRSIHLKASIMYMETRLNRKGGLNLYLAGLRDGNQKHMRDGLELIKQHSGFKASS